MRFITGPPTFAIEVRSEHDTGPTAEILIAARRADYFEAGTRIVWDVDTQAQIIRAYSITTPAEALLFTPDDSAHAEPILPGWRLAAGGWSCLRLRTSRRFG